MLGLYVKSVSFAMLGVCIGKCDIMIYCLAFVREGTVFDTKKWEVNHLCLTAYDSISGEEGCIIFAL